MYNVVHHITVFTPLGLFYMLSWYNHRFKWLLIGFYLIDQDTAWILYLAVFFTCFCSNVVPNWRQISGLCASRTEKPPPKKSHVLIHYVCHVFSFLFGFFFFLIFLQIVSLLYSPVLLSLPFQTKYSFVDCCMSYCALTKSIYLNKEKWTCFLTLCVTLTVTVRS